MAGGCLFRLARGVFKVSMFATRAKSNRSSPLDRQITTPENQASAEFNPINPLEQGLGDRFFGFLGWLVDWKGVAAEMLACSLCQEQLSWSGLVGYALTK
jgi:hypothetical protein